MRSRAGRAARRPTTRVTRGGLARGRAFDLMWMGFEPPWTVRSGSEGFPFGGLASAARAKGAWDCGGRPSRPIGREGR